MLRITLILLWILFFAPLLLASGFGFALGIIDILRGWAHLPRLQLHYGLAFWLCGITLWIVMAVLAILGKLPGTKRAKR